jgi:phosphoesterase RecJ-like protein
MIIMFILFLCWVTSSLSLFPRIINKTAILWYNSKNVPSYPRRSFGLQANPCQADAPEKRLLTFAIVMLNWVVNILNYFDMGLNSSEQLLDQLRKNNSILICVGKNPDGDALGSALGLYAALQKSGKKVDIVSPDALPVKYSFLPHIKAISHKLQGARDYIFALDIDKDKLQQLRYEVEDHKLKIFITAKNGEIEKDRISLESSKFTYDLIIVLGASDLESLGRLYDDNPELFYDIPVINIDHKPTNEYFGKINLVDVAASSTAEIVYTLLGGLDENFLDENIATDLLTGVISETESFQNKNTTPKAFMTAANLIAKGANKQDIIRYLYKTKSVSLLKLMGKAMAGLKYNSQYKLAWSVIEDDSFIKANSAGGNINTAIRELSQSSPEFDLFFLLYVADGKITGIISFSEKQDIQRLMKALGGHMEEGQLVFSPTGTDMGAAEKEVLRKIKEWFDQQKQN